MHGRCEGAGASRHDYRFDAAPLQIDDVFQKKFLGNVGEVKARQVFVVLPLGEGRKRSAELLVHTGGADTLNEFAVLEFSWFSKYSIRTLMSLRTVSTFNSCFAFPLLWV